MDTPFVSIVIPTRNRLKLLKHAINGVREQDYPHDRFEVIVVDDGSTDGTGEWLRATAAGENGISITALHQQHGGPGAARNLGIESAAGEYVAFTDDDCIPDKEWLSNLVTSAVGSHCAAFGGKIVNREARGVISRYCSHIGFNTSFVHGDYLDSLNTANAIVRTSVLREVGGFDLHFRFPTAEDTEITHRMRRSGHEFGKCPSAVVAHLGRDTWGGLHRTFYNRGLGEGYLRARNGGAYRSFRLVLASLVKTIINLAALVVLPWIQTPLNLLRGQRPAADAFCFPVIERTKRIAKHCGHLVGTLAYYLEPRRADASPTSSRS